METLISSTSIKPIHRPGRRSGRLALAATCRELWQFSHKYCSHNIFLATGRTSTTVVSSIVSYHAQLAPVPGGVRRLCDLANYCLPSPVGVGDKAYLISNWEVSCSKRLNKGLLRLVHVANVEVVTLNLMTDGLRGSGQVEEHDLDREYDFAPNSLLRDIHRTLLCMSRRVQPVCIYLAFSNSKAVQDRKRALEFGSRQLARVRVYLPQIMSSPNSQERQEGVVLSSALISIDQLREENLQEVASKIVEAWNLRQKESDPRTRMIWNRTAVRLAKTERQKVKGTIRVLIEASDILHHSSCNLELWKKVMGYQEMDYIVSGKLD